MSAWVPTKAHIDAMVTMAIELGSGNASERYGYIYFSDEKIDLSPQNANRVGQLLRDNVVDGVHDRYPDDDVSKGELPGPGGGERVWYLQPYEWAKTRKLDDGEVVALISAYEYQACEHNDWPITFAFKFCDRIKDRLLERVRAAWKAKNKRDTEWGYDEIDVFPDCKWWAVSLRSAEFPSWFGPVELVAARSSESALEYAAMYYDKHAEVLEARLWEGGDTLTKEVAEAEAARNAEWVAERTPQVPEHVEPPAPTFVVPEGIPAELAAILTRAAQAQDDDAPVRNSR